MPRLLVPKRSMSRRRMSTTSFSAAAAASIFLPTTPARLAAHPGYAAFAVFTKRLRSGTLAPDDARHLFDGLLQGDDPAPAYILNGLLHDLARAPPSAACGDGAALTVELFGLMHQGDPRSRPTADIYATLIHGCCCRAHRQGLALTLLGHVIRTGVGLGVDGAVCKSLLKALCFHGDMGPEEALDVLHQRMPELGCAPCVVSYTIVLKSLCDKGRSQQALQLLRTMAGEGGACSPNVVSYNTVIHGFLTEGREGEALSLFDEMKKQGIAPCVVTYNSIIGFWCKAKSIEKAEAILQQMVDNGVPQDNTTFSTMMHGYSKVGQWKEVDRMFNAMTSQGRYPNLTTCNIYMAALCKQGRGKEAQGCLVDMDSLFRLMVGDGIIPDECVFNIMINAYCLVGNMKKAMGLVAEMISTGLEPNVRTYGTLINGYCKNGRIDDALTLFKQMPVEPTTIVYNSILHGLFLSGRTVAAMEQLHEMIKRGMKVGIDTYSMILRGLCKNNCTNEAIELFQKLCAVSGKFDSILLNVMINELFKVGRSREAKDLFSEISTYGLVTGITYCTMMKKLIEEGSLEEADNLFSSMEKTGCPPDSHLLNVIIRMLFRIGEIVKAGNYLSKLDENNLSLERSTTSLMIVLFSSKGKFREHIDLLPTKYKFLDETI